MSTTTIRGSSLAEVLEVSYEETSGIRGETKIEIRV